MLRQQKEISHSREYHDYQAMHGEFYFLTESYTMSTFYLIGDAENLIDEANLRDYKDAYVSKFKRKAFEATVQSIVKVLATRIMCKCN